MPIKKENRYRYPKNWKAITQDILIRARYQCETCGAPDRAWIHRNRETPKTWSPATHSFAGPNWKKAVEVVLAVAHLDHIPEHCGPSDLRALCQYCHTEHDRTHQRKNAALTLLHQMETQGQLSFLTMT